jgi:2-methylcitrate dehydratase
LTPHFDQTHVKKLMELGNNPAELYKMDIDEYMDLYVKEKIL